MTSAIRQWFRPRLPGPGELTPAAVYWTLAAFLVAAFPHLMAMPPALAATIVGLITWRALAVWRGWRPVPGPLRVILTLALLGLVVIAFGASWGRRLATALLCVMLAAKLMEMFRVRDLRMVASVCFFLVATQFLFNERLVYLAYLVAGCWLATQALGQIQRIQVNQRRSPGNPLQPGAPISLAALTLGGLRQSGKLLAMALPVALVLFFLFPRLAQPLWGLPEEAMDGRTGLSDSMSPGSISELFLDHSPAFRVEFDGPPPPPQQRYWRGPVLWRFDGTTWQRAFFADQHLTEPLEESAASIRYRMQLEPHERRWLLALDYPVSSNFPESRVTVDHQLISRRPVTTLSQYDVVSTPDALISPVLTDLQRTMALNLPQERNPRTLALAEELRQRYADDQDLINAVLRWFNEDEFYYSLSVTPLGRHGADEFLFDLRTGYCEYYASAFAVLMRAAGIPTRVITGYQGGFWSEAGQYLLVRQSDAHAWNEVWLEGQGWVRVDPTAAVAPNRIREGSRSVVDSGRALRDASWLMNLRNQYDRVQHLWNRWVLGFDAERQQDFLKRLGLPELSTTQIGLLMLGALALLLLPLSWFLFRVAGQRPLSPAERSWKLVLRRLKRVGLVRQPAETPREFAGRISSELEQGGRQVVQLSIMFSQLHYGQYSDRLLEQFERSARRFRPSRRVIRRRWGGLRSSRGH
ncbi:MAG: transglutaminase TgpA family protein [Wenzhouxiangella sp.]